MTTIILGASLAQMGEPDDVVEFNFAMTTVCDFFDLEFDTDQDRNLHLNHQCTAMIDTPLYEAPCDLDVVPSGANLAGVMGTSADSLKLQLPSLCDTLGQRHDTINIDTGTGLRLGPVFPSSIADSVVLVTTPRLVATYETTKTKNIGEHVGGEVIGMVSTQSAARPYLEFAKSLRADGNLTSRHQLVRS